MAPLCCSDPLSGLLCPLTSRLQLGSSLPRLHLGLLSLWLHRAPPFLQLHLDESPLCLWHGFPAFGCSSPLYLFGSVGLLLLSRSASVLSSASDPWLHLGHLSLQLHLGLQAFRYHPVSFSLSPSWISTYPWFCLHRLVPWSTWTVSEGSTQAPPSVGSGIGFSSATSSSVLYVISLVPTSRAPTCPPPLDCLLASSGSFFHPHCVLVSLSLFPVTVFLSSCC